MVNMATLNAALWKIQIAKAEQIAFNKRNGLEGSWGATQQIAMLIQQEASIQNAISLHNAGMESTRINEVEFMANQIVSTYPSVH